MDRKNCWIWVSLAVALVATGGSLFLSIGMGLEPCPLCYYQRTLAMAAVGVLAIGLLSRNGDTALLSALALPLASAGFAVAAFHTYLELSGTLECPGGVFGWGTAPQQSLFMFLLLFGALVLAARHPWLTPAAIALGLVFAVGLIAGSPPLPDVRTMPYEEPLEKCRRPYLPPEAK